MYSRQAIWLMLASAVSLFVTTLATAQLPKATPASGSAPATAQIIPVSFTNEQIAASVNGEKILVGEVRKILDSRPYPLSLTEEQKKEMRKAALDSLIEDSLMRQYLSKHVPQYNQVEFTKEVNELQEVLKKQNKTVAMFLKENGQTEDQLRRDIIARLQWKVVLQRFLPDDKAKIYYDTNKVFFDKVMVRASHIMIKLPANTTKEQRDLAAQKLLIWRQDILAGKVKFEDLAKQHSDCPTKDKGGDIGQFPYKFVVVPEFARAAYSMKVGEISGPIPTIFGVHLIKVTERTPGEVSNFATIKDSVREIWAQDEEVISRILADQRKTGDIKVNLP